MIGFLFLRLIWLLRGTGLYGGGREVSGRLGLCLSRRVGPDFNRVALVERGKGCNEDVL